MTRLTACKILPEAAARGGLLAEPNTVGPPDAYGAVEPVAVRFAGVNRPLIVANAPEVISGISAVTRGWDRTYGPASPTDLDKGAGRVDRGQRGFDVASSFVETRFMGLPLASAVCAALADVAEARAATYPEVALLHAAAVEMRGQVVAFVGRSRAGKSTLVARLGMRDDLLVYCDDMLPVNPDGTAVALGIAPRIRLPLPPAAKPAFCAHVAAATVLVDDSYAFLSTPNLAPYGTTAKLGAVVWLDRSARGKPRISAVPAAEAISRLREADMQTADDAGARATRLEAIVAGVTCLEMVYADLEEAVATICSLMGGAEGAPALTPARARRGKGRRRAVPPDLPLVRDPLAVTRPAPSGLWLTRRNASGLVHLNSVGAAIWELLEEGATCTGVSAVLAEVFPEIEERQILADVEQLLGDMLDVGLVHPAEPVAVEPTASQPGASAG